MLYDVIILGNGPAGSTAAIYTKRGNLNTLVLSHNKSPLLYSGNIENYYGFPKGIDGKELFNLGIEQAKSFGVEFEEGEAIAIEKKENTVVVKTSSASYEGKVLLFATGNPPLKVKIENLEKFEGNGVAYCATCDGFFYTDLKVGILGFKDFAIEEAIDMLSYTNDITIFTHGRQLTLSEKFQKEIPKFKVNTKKIKSLQGENGLEEIEFADSTKEKIDGIFVAFGSASSLDFAKKMGILTEGSLLKTDSSLMTNIDGIFGAGSCTYECQGLNQIATSVGQGALAGKKILEYLGKDAKEPYNIR